MRFSTYCVNYCTPIVGLEIKFKECLPIRKPPPTLSGQWFSQTSRQSI